MKLFLILLTFLTTTVSAQSTLSGNLLYLLPTTLTATCRNGDIRVDTASSPLSLKLCSSNTWGAITPGQWVTAGSDIYRLTGNVGIGTTSPNYESAPVRRRVLTIAGDGSTADALGILEFANAYAPAAGNSLGSVVFSQPGNLGDTRVAQINGAVEGSGGASGYGGVLTFTTKRDNTTASEKMRITSSGNIGIGTTSPSFPLHLERAGLASPGSHIMQVKQTSNTGASTDSNALIAISHSNGTNTRTWSIGTGSNTLFGHPDNFGIYDFTGTKTAMVIERNSGNVGIGNVAPRAKLDVVGNITADSAVLNSGTTEIGLGSNGGGGAIKTKIIANATGSWGKNDLHFALNINGDGNAATIADSKMTIKNNGNVGMGGVTDPMVPLSIAAQGTTVGTHEQLGLRSQRIAITSGALISGMSFRSNDTSNTAPGIIVANIGAVATATHTASVLDTALTFTTTSTLSNTEKMRILGNGNVGIGTTAPGNLLDLSKSNVTAYTATSVSSANPFSASDPVLKITNSNGADNDGAFIGFSTKAGDGTYNQGYIGAIAKSGTWASNIVFGNRTASAGYSERMRIDSSGNVGIGTTAPGTALDVKGTLRLSGSSSGYVGLAPAAAAGSTTYTLPSSDGASGQVLQTNGSGTMSWRSVGGAVVQETYCEFSTPTTLSGYSTIPLDNTIPQQTEGAEVMTCSITPQSASNNLLVEAHIWVDEGNNVYNIVAGAIFRDSTADAIAAGIFAEQNISTALMTGNFVMRKRVSAASTSATTFKFRIAEGNGTNSININKYAGGNVFNGTYISTMTIKEIVP